jgi:hypothetical protein
MQTTGMVELGKAADTSVGNLISPLSEASLLVRQGLSATSGVLGTLDIQKNFTNAWLAKGCGPSCLA